MREERWRGEGGCRCGRTCEESVVKMYMSPFPSLATGEYGPALSSYLEAGALESQHFEEEVPASVWTQQVMFTIGY